MTESQDERLGLPSASSWRRYELCAGSYQLEGEARKLNQLAHKTSPAAQRGTRIHNYLAGVVDEDGKEIKLDEEEQDDADFLQARAQEQAERVFANEPTQQLAEKRLWLLVNGRKAASGQFDRVIYTPTLALIQDFKSGQSEPQEAEISSQMKFLAVLVGLALPSVKEIVVQVVSVFYGVSERRFSIKDLAEAYRDALKTLRAMQALQAPLVPSPEACHYCGAINVCPAVKNLVPAMREVEALPDGDRGAKLLDEVAVLQKRLDSIREYYAKRLTEDPTYELPGYAMVPGNVRREIASANWEAARKRLGEWLDLSEIEAASNYRLGDLEKALGKKLKIKGKELKDRLAQILNGLIELKENAASLKRVSGKPQLVEIAAL